MNRHPFCEPGARRWLNAATAAAFVLPLLTYWLTAAPDVSFWDCPEYVAVASRLEVGHPPGNPVWQLVSAVIASLAPAGSEARWINLSSGLWTAAAMALLLRCIAVVLALCLPGRTRGNRAPLCCLCALCATLCCAWCDSVWFSAVEAEVYALSLMLTVLTLWLMLRWWLTPRRDHARRVQWLVLIAYVTGLSLGVHQLNLLVLPALGVVYAYRQRPDHAAGYAVWCMLLGMVAVALVLTAMMPGALRLAGIAEWRAVNDLGLPFDSGVLIYLALTFAAVAASLAVLQRRRPHRLPAVIAVASALFLSGIFMIADSVIAAACLSAVAAVGAVCTRPFTLRAVRGAMWMLAATLAGYSAYAVIPLAASACPPLNTGAPSDIFALRSYVCRDQYGKTPLLRGRTPYSKPLLQEHIDSAGHADYSRYALIKGEPRILRTLPGARLMHRSRMLTAADSAANRRALGSGRGAYVLADYSFSTVTTPELDMWLPRIVSGDPADIEAYGSWVGMTKDNMVRVAVSEVVDTAGNFANRLNDEGDRPAEYSYRPTYLQSLGMMFSYQMGYMYMRYLLWNFAGRQNDFLSGGEADHGNFITGLSALDDAMLGPQSQMPPEAAGRNPGRNVYYMLPLLLGLAGIMFTVVGGRQARRWGTVVLVLWLMTGLAIVVYLNQAPGEPRERDYSFLGSYAAFAFWIGMGALAVSVAAARMARGLRVPRPSRAAVCVAAAALAVPAWMLSQNLDDHDRSGRYGARDLALNVLQSLPQGAVLLTDGDNLTFPLWYAQEVLGVRQDVAVVNLSYLNMASYVASLRVPMVGKPGDWAYGRYSMVRVPAGGDTVPLVQMLRALYAADDPAPRLMSRYALLGDSTGSAVLDLRQVSGGSSMLRQPALAWLDMTAASLETPGRGGMHWINGLPARWRAGVDSLLVQGLFALRLEPAGPRCLEPSVLRAAAGGQLRGGGCDLPRPPYYDPATARMMRWQRASALSAAALLADSARTAEAVCLARLALELWPDSVVGLDFITVSDTAMHEAAQAARLLALSDRPADRRRAEGILRDDSLRMDSWLRYWQSLPPRLRPLTSPAARRNAARARRHTKTQTDTNATPDTNASYDTTTSND